jgi:hypothetical protein
MFVLRHPSPRCRPSSKPFFVALTALLVIVWSAKPGLAQGPPDGLPPQAAPQAEVMVEGELDVLYEDAPGGARLMHFLQTADRRLRLLFDGDLPPGLSTGARVRARGQLQNDVLALSSSGGSVETMTLASPATFGQQRTLVMLVNFQDNPTQPYTVEAAHRVTFEETSAFFLENSYQQTWLTGDTIGWITLPMTSGTCDYYKISSLAEEEAGRQGINVSQYPRRIFAFPQIGACSWWGLGNVGGNPSRSWVNGSYALKVVAHELGHNFGVHHSRSASCDAGGCTTSEYGDTHDIMGSPTGHMNAFQKERVGWLNYGSSPRSQTVTSAGTYWVDSMSVPPTGAPKALRILKSTDSNGNRTWYFVEARARTGFDGTLAPGVLIHTGSEATGNSSLQLDMTPGTSGFHGVLEPGYSFTDPAIGLTISTVGVNGAGASIFVDYPGAPCTSRAPTVSLSPGSTTLSPGQSTTLTLSVRNNDDSACASTEFLVSAGGPSGWSVVAGLTRLLVAPGVSTSTTVIVTPGSDASGTATITAHLNRATTSGSGATTSAVVTVATALNVSVSVGTSGGGYTFTATVRAAGGAVSGAPVSFTVTGPAGDVIRLSATTNGTGVATAKWKPKPRDPRGTYQLGVSVTAGGLSGTAAGSFVH